MSRVTNIMITGLILDDEIIIVKNQLKKLTVDTSDFIYINEYEPGGSKKLESDVFIKAFNYLDYELFCNTIHELSDLLEPHIYNSIQIIIQSQEDSYWHIHSVSELNEDSFESYI